MAETTSYAGELQAAFRGCDTARSLKSLLAELLTGGENSDVATRIRSDNSIVVDHVHPINSVGKE